MSYKVIDRSSYYRKGVFRHFSEDCKCSLSMTARVDVTDLVAWHIVEQCREEEGEDAENPQQFLLVGGGNLVGDDAEALIVLNQGDDGHGAEQEEHYLGRLAEVLHQMLADEVVPTVAVESWLRDGAAEDEDGPQEGAEGEGRGGLVDFERMLHSDAEVSDYENSY